MPALIFWLAAVNLIALGLMIWALFKLPAERFKWGFLMVVPAMLTFVNPILIIRMPGLDIEAAAIVSRSIFLGGVLMNTTFGYFILTLAEPDETRKLWFWILLCNNIVVMFLTLGGFVDKGVVMSEEGYRPVYGPLRGYLLLSTAAFAAYMFWRMWRFYIRISNEFVKYQIQTILWAGIATFLVAIFFNGVLPLTFNTSRFAPGGALAPLVFFSGTLYTFVNGRTLFVTRAFKKLLKEPEMQSHENLLTLRELIGVVRQVVTDNPERFRKQLSFTGADSEKFELYIHRDGQGETGIESDISVEKGLPAKWLRGFLDSFEQLEKDNKRMAFSLIRAEQVLNEQWLRKAVKDLPAPRRPLSGKAHRLEDYREVLRTNLRENRNTFGRDILCFSPNYFQFLTRLREHARSTQAVLIEGETGSGKALAARAMHHVRGGGEVIDFSCVDADGAELRREIQNFTARADDRRPLGFLLRGLEVLPAEHLPALHPLLNDHNGARYVYITTSVDYLMNANIESDLLYRLKQIVLRTIPLRERPDDILHQIMYMADVCSRSWDKPFEEIASNSIEEALEHKWPGNSRELMHVVQRAVLDNQPPRIISLGLEKPEAKALALPAGLSPLEESERQVILNYLKKNRYNKSKTMRELGITINTLNAKIKRYRIALPGKKV